jgi:hypothetical protein
VFDRGYEGFGRGYEGFGREYEGYEKGYEGYEEGYAGFGDMRGLPEANDTLYEIHGLHNYNLFHCTKYKREMILQKRMLNQVN